MSEARSAVLDRSSTAQATVELPGAPPDQRGFWCVAWLLVTGAVLPAWCCDYFPSHNGPSLLSIAHICKHLDDPQFGYSEFYERHLFPVPYLAQLILSLPLLDWLAPSTILKVLTSTAIVVRFWSVWYWLKQISPTRAILAFAVAPLAYEFSVMRGYLNFHLGISVGLALMGWHLRSRDQWTPWKIFVLNLLALATYFCHAFPLMITGVLMAAFEVGMTGSLRRIPGLIVRGFLPSIALLAAFMLHSRANSGWGGSEISYSSLREKLSHLVSRSGSPLSPFVNFSSLALLLLPFALGTYRLRRTQRDGKPGSGWPWSPYWMVWLAGIGVYLASPSVFLGWHKAELHILPYALITSLAAVPEFTTIGRRWIYTGAALAIVWGGALPQIRTLRAGSDLVGEYLAGVDSLPRRVAFLSLSGATEESASKQRSVFDPVQWADGYYLMARGGGLGRSLIVNNTIYPVWFHDFREKGRVRFPAVTLPEPTEEELNRASRSYGGVLLWDCPDRVETMMNDHGFQTVFSRGRIRVLTRAQAAAAPATDLTKELSP